MITRDENRLNEANAVLWPLCFGCNDPIDLTMAQLIEALSAAQMAAPFHGPHISAALTGLRALEQSAWLAHNPPIISTEEPDPEEGEGE